METNASAERSKDGCSYTTLMKKLKGNESISDYFKFHLNSTKLNTHHKLETRSQRIEKA